MKINKTPLMLAMALSAMHSIAVADDLLVESFETDGDGVRYTASIQFNDGVNDHFQRTDGGDISNTTGPYSGVDGTFFWAAEDVNDNGGNELTPQTIDFTGIDISGFNNLAFTGLFAAGNESLPGASNYDLADFVTIEYQIDGGGFQNGVCFGFERAAPGDDFNEPFGLDADCSGESDGPAGRLGTVLTNYGFSIPATGSVLDLRISVSVDSGSEEFAFDNFKITGDLNVGDVAPRVSSIDPMDAAIDVAFDSNIEITFSEEVVVAANAVNLSCSISGNQSFPAAIEGPANSLTIDPTDFSLDDVCAVTIDSVLVTDTDGTPDPLDGDGDGMPGGDFSSTFTVESDEFPVVIGSTPSNGSVGFDNSADIEIILSEPVDATIDAITFECTQSGTVAFAGLPVSGSDIITLNPDVDLIDSEICTVTAIGTEITDVDGAPNFLEDGNNFVLNFTVGFPIVEIFEIQGSGLGSPFDGQRVSTVDNIVTALDVNGFYMQTPDARDDGVLATSNGIFVFTGNNPTTPVAVGDQVDVTGDVVEFFNLTEFTNPGTLSVSIDSSGNALPTAVLLDDNFPSTDPTVFPCGDELLSYECFENMHFDMPQGFISSASVAFFGANRDDVLVKAGSQRAFREPGIDFPGLPDLPVFDGNPELLEMDIDGLTLPVVPLTAGSSVMIKGVFGADFGEYEIWPSDIQFIEENELPGAVRDTDTIEASIGSANLFRLFNAIDDPGPEDDDQIADPAEYAQRLVKISNYFRNDLKAPAIIALQEVENLDVVNDLITQIIADGGPAYTAALVEGNDVGGIDVAYMYQATIVSNVVITQLGADEQLSLDASLLHDRPPLRMQADVTINGEAVRVNLLAVHMRSRSRIDDPSDGARVRQKRLEQAQSIAVMVDDIQTEVPSEPVIVLGDFNAFEFTDGYVDVTGQIAGTAVETDNLLWAEPLFVAEPLTQAVQSLTPDEQYSFVFQGSAQVLDNALMNDVALPLFVEMQFARANADAPLLFETNAATSQRSSDHDGFVLFLANDTDLIFKNGFE